MLIQFKFNDLGLIILAIQVVKEIIAFNTNIFVGFFFFYWYKYKICVQKRTIIRFILNQLLNIVRALLQSLVVCF